MDVEFKTNTSRGFQFGLSNGVSPSSITTIGLYAEAGATLKFANIGVAGVAIATWSVAQYTFWTVEFSDGFAQFGTGGVLGSDICLLWIDHTHNDATLYPAIQSVSSTDAEFGRGALVDGLGGIFSGDYTLAVFDVTSFDQSLGADLSTNGDFASGLTGWNLSHTPPDPEVTQVAPGNTHGGGGTGAANLYSTANFVGMGQTILS